ncbi:MAG: hypothetical protein AAF570_04150 [Bacteroidota bacterium]
MYTEIQFNFLFENPEGTYLAEFEEAVQNELNGWEGFAVSGSGAVYEIQTPDDATYGLNLIERPDHNGWSVLLQFQRKGREVGQEWVNDYGHAWMPKLANTLYKVFSPFMIVAGQGERPGQQNYRFSKYLYLGKINGALWLSPKQAELLKACNEENRPWPIKTQALEDGGILGEWPGWFGKSGEVLKRDTRYPWENDMVAFDHNRFSDSGYFSFLGYLNGDGLPNGAQVMEDLMRDMGEQLELRYSERPFEMSAQLATVKMAHYYLYREDDSELEALMNEMLPILDQPIETASTPENMARLSMGYTNAAFFESKIGPFDLGFYLPQSGVPPIMSLVFDLKDLPEGEIFVPKDEYYALLAWLFEVCDVKYGAGSDGFAGTIEDWEVPLEEMKEMFPLVVARDASGQIQFESGYVKG